ncbi:MAG: DUF115 domain-containing protein [Deltaproteobacteria bacterium]|nr:DUF115 domain-containing protein [Deltaproteobacteria bacterium]
MAEAAAIVIGTDPHLITETKRHASWVVAFATDNGPSVALGVEQVNSTQALAASLYRRFDALPTLELVVDPALARNAQLEALIAAVHRTVEHVGDTLDSEQDATTRQIVTRGLARLDQLADRPTIDVLAGRFVQRPALIVGADLDAEQLDQLARHARAALIIAEAASVAKLQRLGIEPAIVVATSPVDGETQLPALSEQTWLVTPALADVELFQHSARRHALFCGYGRADRWLLLDGAPALDGASDLRAAYALARRLECYPVRAIGIDQSDPEQRALLDIALERTTLGHWLRSLGAEPLPAQPATFELCIEAQRRLFGERLVGWQTAVAQTRGLVERMLQLALPCQADPQILALLAETEQQLFGAIAPVGFIAFVCQKALNRALATLEGAEDSAELLRSTLRLAAVIDQAATELAERLTDAAKRLTAR